MGMAGGMRPAGAAAAPELMIHMGHTPLDAQKRIKQLLIMLTPDYLSLTSLSAALMEDLRAHQLHEFLAQTLLHCVKSLPQKSMIFVGLLAALRIQMHKEAAAGKAAPMVAASALSSSEAVPEGPDQFFHLFLRATGDALLEACSQGSWNELRLLMRFITGLGLANLIGVESVWEMVDHVYGLLSSNVGANGAPLPHSQREYLLFTLISLIPFMAEHCDEPRFLQLQASLQNMVNTRAQARRGRLSGRDLMSVTARKPASISAAAASSEESKMNDEDTPAAASSSSSSVASASDNNGFCFDLIDSWWNALLSMKSREAYLQDASEVSIQRSSYQCFRVELDNLCKPIPLSTNMLITIPAGPAPRLRPVLRLFPRMPKPTVSNIPLNALLIGDYIGDLLTIFEAIHKEGTKQLLSLPLPLSDEARQSGQFLLIESVFENLLMVPEPPVKPIYYGTIFIDLFKAQPNLMPPLLGSALNALFHRLEQLDLEVVERLQDWFTFHLSNFGYVWPWVSWGYVLEQAETHPQRRFVANSLALCVRLSYWERIQQVIPEDFLALMPHQPHAAFRFSSKNIESAQGDLNIQMYYQLSLELGKILAGKAAPNAVIGWLDASVTGALGAEARLRLFTPCLLEAGNKSYSHMIALLDRYKSVFQILCSTTIKKRPINAQTGEPEGPEVLLSPFDCQRLILHSLSEYWQHSQQHLIVLTDQFFSHGIISMQSVIAWVFFSGRHPERQTHLWKDVLFVLLRRTLARLQKEVEAVLQKPRHLALSAERKAEDERQIEALFVERRELLVSCVSNFQRLMAEIQKREVTKTKDRLRMEQDLTTLTQRFTHFARAVSRTCERTQQASRMMDLKLILVAL